MATMSIWSKCLILPYLFAIMPLSMSIQNSTSSRRLTGQVFLLDQPVTHFGPNAETDKFKQRYYYDHTFFKPEDNKPTLVFLQLSGESEDMSLHTHVLTLAEEMGAIILVLEHRFYGQSFPTNDFSIDNLKKLHTSDQAIEDVLWFKRFAIEKHQLANPKFILFGGSYAGGLVAWTLAAHKDHFVGAISSSPVLEAKLRFNEFFDGVAETFRDSRLGGSCGCLCLISQAHEEVKDLLKSEGGRRIVEAQFGLAKERVLEEEENRAFWFRNGLLGLDPATNDPECRDNLCNIKKICQLFEINPDEDRPVEILSAVSRANVRRSGHFQMRADYQSEHQKMADPSSNHASRMWIFQQMNELGLFTSCVPGTECPFIQDEDAPKVWTRIAGAMGYTEAEVADNVEHFNRMKGGRQWKDYNIFFIHGSSDPWKNLLTSLRGKIPEDQEIWMESASHIYWGRQQSKNLPPTKALINMLKNVVNVFMSEPK